MPIPISPAARRAMQPCQCGHRHSLHHNYGGGPCIGKIGLGKLEKPCPCKRFANPVPNHQPTNPTYV